jgi:hypothetical protein
MLELNGKPSSVITFSTDFSFQNLIFWNLFQISATGITKNQYLPHSKSKSYQTNSINPCSSRSLQQDQRHIPIPPKISVKKSFNIQELLHHKSKCHGTKPMHPSLSRAFQRHKEHNLKHPGSGDLITTIQNKSKQTTFLHR